MLALGGVLWAGGWLAVTVVRPKLSARYRAQAEAVDLLLVSALTLASGGAMSEIRPVFFLFPILASIRGDVRDPIIWGAAASVSYLVVSVAHGTDVPAYATEAATQAAFLAGFTAIAAGIAQTIAAGRRRLLARQGDLEREVGRNLELNELIMRLSDEERSRLALAIHDGPLQDLLAARRDIDLTMRGDADAVFAAHQSVERAETTLRAVTSEMHSYQLEHLGLAEALAGLARRVRGAEWGGRRACDRQDRLRRDGAADLRDRPGAARQRRQALRRH